MEKKEEIEKRYWNKEGEKTKERYTYINGSRIDLTKFTHLIEKLEDAMNENAALIARLIPITPDIITYRFNKKSVTVTYEYHHPTNFMQDHIVTKNLQLDINSWMAY